jgi:hypothetical protein
MWSTTTLCDKSRDAGDTSTNFGELETNLTERCHGLMWTIKKRDPLARRPGWPKVCTERVGTFATDKLACSDAVRCSAEGVCLVKKACAA